MKIYDVFRKPICKDHDHDFVRPHPLTCRKCGAILRWNEQELLLYMGSYMDDVAYQWTPRMDEKKITSFSLSAGDRPVFSASCDFSSLTIRSALNGSRDGWMQSRYPSGYFEPRSIRLCQADIDSLKDFFRRSDFLHGKHRHIM